LVSIIFTQTGFATAYLIFIPRNLASLYSGLTQFHYSLILYIPVLLICMLRKWRLLAPFGLLGVLAIFFGTGVVSVHAITVMEPTWERVNAVQWATMPIFFGIIAYIYEGIGLVIDMERAMKKPQQFLTQMWVAYIFLSILFIGYGSIGYIAFGDKTNQISLLNLPTSTLTTVSMILVCIALYFTYPIQIFPVFSILENILFNTSTTCLFWKTNLLRVLVVTLSWGISVLFANYFSYFLSLIGSVGCSLLAFIIPATFYMKLFWKESSLSTKVLNVAMLSFGLVASIFSTAVTIYGFFNPN